MSSETLAEMLRALLSEVDGDASARVTLEREEVGHAVKTTITVWTLDRPPAPAVQWCDRLIPNARRPDTLCGAMLLPDGRCPREVQHQRAVR